MKNKFTNKRKINFLNLNFGIILILILFLIVTFYSIFNNEKLYNNYHKIIQHYSNKFNFNITSFDISNLEYIDDEIILEYFTKYQNTSIFLVPTKEIYKKMMQNRWINNVRIKNDYKNSLKITVEEEIPLGIYVNDNKKILFSYNLLILGILESENQFSKLTKFYGENSIINSKKLFAELNNSFRSQILSAIFIKNRRWNIQLDNLIILLLPEDNIKDALLRYKKIYDNFSNKDLKDVKTIDLRFKHRAIIKYNNT